jgi:hypothetical protein
MQRLLYRKDIITLYDNGMIVDKSNIYYSYFLTLMEKLLVLHPDHGTIKYRVDQFSVFLYNNKTL